MPSKQKETNISTKQNNRLKIPTDGRQTSWLITSMTEKLNQGLQKNNTSLVVKAEPEPATSGFQVQRPNHSVTMPPQTNKGDGRPNTHFQFHLWVYLSLGCLWYCSWDSYHAGIQVPETLLASELCKGTLG